MSSLVTRIAPALLATLTAIVVLTAPAARAEPAGPAAAEETCLAKPNGPSPRGQHWYYRLDRAHNNRQCWYLRAYNANAGEADTTKPTALAAPKARPRVLAAPLPERVPDPPPTTAEDDSAMPPVTASPGAPLAWPRAPEPQRVPLGEAPAEPPPPPAAIESRPDAPPTLEAEARPVKRARAAPAIERPTVNPERAVVVEATDHMPALVGTASVLAVILVVSLGAHLAVGHIRRKRRAAAELPAVSRDTMRMHDSPSITAAMPSNADIVRETFAPSRAAGAARAPSQGRRAEPRPAEDRAVPWAAPDAASRRDSAEAIEQNVRDLLHRLRTELQPRSETDAPPTRPRASFGRS